MVSQSDILYSTHLPLTPEGECRQTVGRVLPFRGARGVSEGEILIFIDLNFI